jgi:hypothetical protein
MRTKALNHAAFSLVEVLMSATLLVLTVAGAFTTFSAVRANVANKESALEATVFGKQVLEALYSQVTDSGAYAYYSGCVTGGCGGGCCDFSLSVGNHNVPTANLPLPLVWPGGNGGPMATLNGNQVSYTVTCADGSGGPGCTNSQIAHKVTMNIKWTSLP